MSTQRPHLACAYFCSGQQWVHPLILWAEPFLSCTAPAVAGREGYGQSRADGRAVRGTDGQYIYRLKQTGAEQHFVCNLFFQPFLLIIF